MLVMGSTSVSFNALSQDENGHNLASMSANHTDGGSVYFSLTVEADDATVDADFDEFKKKVFASVASVNEME